MRKTIVVNWDYSRVDLSSHIFELCEWYNVILLFYYFKKDDKEIKKPKIKYCYWEDFKTPQQIINKFNPQLILFHDIESIHQLALNTICINKKIKTVVLEHGLRRASELDIDNSKNKPYHKRFSKFRTLFFYLSALKKSSNKIDLLLILYYRKTLSFNQSFLKIRNFKIRQASYYINFTHLNASYIIKRDNIPLSKLILIGNPTFDLYLNKFNLFNKDIGTNKYVLIIDSPFVEDDNFNMSINEKTNLIEEVVFQARKSKCSVKIKLHPKSYKNISKYQKVFDKTITTFYTESDIVDLIRNSEIVVFFHQSGLLPFALYYSRCIMFNVYPEYNIDLINEGLLSVIDYPLGNNYKFEAKELTEEKKSKIIENYFFSIDGRSTERFLKSIENIIE
jgi:hypothetical protein